MSRRKVASTSIETVGYDASTSTLEIVFTDGMRYLYLGVPKPVYCELMGAESAGRYFNRNIKGSYPFKEI